MSIAAYPKLLKQQSRGYIGSAAKQYPQMLLVGYQIKNTKPTAKTYKLTDGKGLCLQVTPVGGTLWR